MVPQRVYWREEERELLVQLVKQYTVNNRTNWKQISEHLPGHTPNQCKAQYVLGICRQPSKGVNIIWNQRQEAYCIALIQFYDNDIPYVHQNFYQDLPLKRFQRKVNNLLYQVQCSEIFINDLMTANVLSQADLERLEELIKQQYYITHFYFEKKNTDPQQFEDVYQAALSKHRYLKQIYQDKLNEKAS